MNLNDSGNVFLGNNAALDFINTQIMRRGKVVDLLTQAADLSNWAREAGHTLQSEPSEVDLTAAKALRSALGELFLAQITGSKLTKRSLDTVNRYLAKQAHHEMLIVNDHRELELLADESASNFSTLLAQLAYDGAQLLASPQAASVKRCSNPECILLFLDTSRSKKRRWCNMDTCGNRAKAARHYRSQT